MENTEITTEKIDDNTLRVVKTVPVAFDFTLDALIEQRNNIQAQKDRDNAQRDVELAEVDGLIAKCEELNIVSKPVEEPVIEEPVIEAPIEETTVIDTPIEETPVE